MTDRYLPQQATVDEASAWLAAEIGGEWPLSRLVEYGLTPRFWLDYAPGCDPIFGERREGLFIRINFQPDLERLAVDRTAILTLGALPDGRLFKIDPPLRPSLADLRFSAAELRELVGDLRKSAPLVPTHPRKGNEPALTNEQQQEVSRRLAAGETQDSLRIEFGVSRKTIAKYKPATTKPAPASPFPTAGITRHRVK